MKPRVTVGLSASTNPEVLKWAIDETIRWNGQLLIVHSFDDPVDTELPTPLFERTERAQAFLNETVAEAKQCGVEPVAKLCDGPPRRALVLHSKGSQLLVIGPDRKGLMSRTLQGSTVQYCLQRAYCPVTVVLPARAPIF
jgi:nucleotide-binding universal stress UspA family protein